MSDDEGDTAILLERSPTSNDKSVSNSTTLTDNFASFRYFYQKSLVVVLASVIAAIGGLLFGYDVGIVSGALLQLETEWMLNCYQKQIVVSSMLFGALAASCVGGFVVDFIGRKLTIILNSLVFIIGALIISLSQGFNTLICGRIVIGFAVSLSVTSECIYISEIAPSKRRGLLVSLNEFGITFGFLLAYLVNYLLSDRTEGWRYMFGLSAIPAAVQLIGMIFLPPSPHYLMLKKREHQAEKVLSNLRGKPDVRQELTNIRLALDAEKDQGCFTLFRQQDNMRYRMLMAMGLVLFQQLTGQPNVLYYSSVIFKSIGFCSAEDATFASVILGITKMLATLLSMCLVDKAGRRVFLLLGAFLMAVTISGLGFIAFVNPEQLKLESCKTLPSPVMPSTRNFSSLNGSLLLTEAPTFGPSANETLNAVHDTCGTITSDFSTGAKWFSVVFLLLYVASYSLGFGPVTWLVLSEIFPTSVKGRAISAATIVNWGTNILISSTFLNVMTYLSVGLTFIIYGLLCLMSAVFVFLVVPETKKKSLHQLSKEIQFSNPSKRIARNMNQIPCCRCCTTRQYHQVSSDVCLNDVPMETSA